jgi:ATP-binding cassette subfamily B protein
MALAYRAAPRLGLALVALTVVGALLPLAVAYVGKLVIDAVVAGDTQAALARVLQELALVVLQAATIRGLGLVRQLLGGRLSVDINLMILRKAQSLSLRHFEDPTFYDQLTKARREASMRPLSVVSDTFLMVQNALTLAGYVALLMAYDWRAAAGLFVAALPATFAEMYFSTAAFRLRNWRAPETRLLNYVEYVLANDEHVKEVRIFGLGPHLLERYASLGEKLYREDQRLAVKRTGWAYALSLAATGAFYACYALMAIAAAAGRLKLGDLTLYVVAFRQGQQAFQSCLTAIGGMYENNLYMSNLFAFLAIPSATPTPPAPAPVPPRVADASERGLRCVGLGFRYPGEAGWALEGVDLVIPAGRSLALVGANGAGNTTLVKLLTRLYEPTAGRVLLDGVDLAAWDEATLRRRMAVVFQDFNQYQFTFGDNVGFGSVEHLGDETRIRRAMDRGGAAELAAGLAQGLATPLGRWFQDGKELSGGQWQKIALARGFMREEADILVLDEPTAALDAEAEYAVFERFRALTTGRTTILISHRFPTVRMADQIVVLGGGRILEQGTHAELVERGGRYAELFRLQARGYA